VFSSRTPDDLEPNDLARLLESEQAAGRRLIDLTASNPTTAALPGAAAWQERVARALAQGALAPYAPEPRGLPAARAAVAAYYRARGLDIASERIVLTASTSEAYGFLFKLLCDPGDEVLIPAPSYPLFAHLAQLDGARVQSYEDGTVPAISRRTRAVIAVSPGNPTGAMLDAAAVDALDRAAAAAGVAVIGDEVFADYVHDPDAAARYTSVLACRRALAFGLSGLSKAAGLPQLKLGWIAVAGPPALCDQALARLDLIADTYLSVSTPVQAALPALLEIGADIRAAIAARVRANRRVLLDAGLDVVPPPAGWYALVRLAPGPGHDDDPPDPASDAAAPATSEADQDDEYWAAALLAEDHVQVYPGYFFDIPSDQGQFLVVSLLPPPDDFAEGVRRLTARLGASRGASGPRPAAAR
jgi:alanine-synthesizing transaminase